MKVAGTCACSAESVKRSAKSGVMGELYHSDRCLAPSYGLRCVSPPFSPCPRDEKCQSKTLGVIARAPSLFIPAGGRKWGTELRIIQRPGRVDARGASSRDVTRRHAGRAKNEGRERQGDWIRRRHAVEHRG